MPSELALLTTDHILEGKDFSACKGFIEVHWEKTWGNLEEHFTAVLNELEYMLELKSQIQNKIILFLKELDLQLSQFQKEVLLLFLRNLYQADPNHRDIKKELYRQFEEALSLK